MLHKPSGGASPGITILMVEHALGGGIRRHVADLVSLLAGRARFMVLAPGPGGLLQLSPDFPDLPPRLYFDPRRELDALKRFLAGCGISRIHYHHLIQLPWELARLPAELDVPYDFTAHDYFSYCPQITLTTESFRYCGEPTEPGCNRCLAIRPTPGNESIEAWRWRQRPFIEGAARVFVPAASVGKRLEKHFPDANFVLASHPEQTDAGTCPDPAWRRVGEGKMKVLVLGALNPTKGPDLLEAAALDAHARNLQVEFHLLGSAYRSLATVPHSALTIHGPYRDAELGTLIDSLAPHIAWFPAQWPETYSYTLSAALRKKLPVVAPAFGAFQDRLSGRPFSWLVPWDMQARGVNDLLAGLATDPSTGNAYLSPPLTGRSGLFSYESDYLPKESRPLPVPPAPVRLSRKHARAWRPNARFVTGYLMASAARALRRIYALPGVQKTIAAMIPEHKLQMLRRRLGGY